MTTTRPTLAIFSLLLMTGCAGLDASSSSDLNKADEANPVAQAGTYITQMLPLEDGCGLEDDLHNPEVIEVTVSDDGSHFEYVEDATKFSCDRNDSGSYDCAIEMPSDGFPIPMHSSMTAEWVSSDRFEGVASMTIECGSDLAICEALSEELNTEFPCTTRAKIIAHKGQAIDFAPPTGEYQLEIAEAGKTSCVTAFPVTPEQLGMVEMVDERSFTLVDEDGGGIPFDCSLDQHGLANCDRLIEVDDIEIESEIQAAWTSENTIEGALAVRVTCNTDDCTAAEATFGELPCTTFYPVKATTEAATTGTE